MQNMLMHRLKRLVLVALTLLASVCICWVELSNVTSRLDAMPFFGNKFSPKKPPPRKNSINGNSEELAEELVTENRTVRLLLGNQQCTFDNGQWIAGNGPTGYNNRIIQKMERRIEELEEENNMLKLRYQIMLDMLSETTAESHLQQREIEKLRKK